MTTHDTSLQKSKREIARQLAEWRNAFAEAGFGDPEAMQLVHAVYKTYVTATRRVRTEPNDS